MMPPDWFNPDNLTDLLSQVLLVLFISLPAYFGYKKVKAELLGVKDQVKNNHSTNLRDDVDRVIDGLADIKSLLSDHSADIRGLREDHAEVRDAIREERRERSALERKVRELSRPVFRLF